MNDDSGSEEVIFTGALEIDSPEKRAAYLDDACGNDAELRRRVDALLSRHDESEGFLDAPPPGVDATIQFRSVSENIGTQVGRYKLLQKLGEGGMGIVYMAEQKEPVRRRVALKIIKPGMDTKEVIARFESERQALALMDHSNIARVLDAGETNSGRPYFVMELVKGVPITEYCDNQRLTPRQRLELFIPICHAVQHAHQKGIIHRDIKPSNILVALFDGRPVPKVIDFGVAKAVSQQLTEKTMFTKYGQIIGTLEYMSPEQAEFNQIDVDTRSDIYSLGVLLYELLIGETPFDKQRLRSAAFDELLRIIREEEPLKPSSKLSTSQRLPSIASRRHTEPKKLSTLVRGEVDWIVMKSLEKDRGRRYQTASGFANDISRHLNGESVTACPPSTLYRLRKFAWRNKTLIVAVALVVMALVGGASAATIMAFRAVSAEKRIKEALYKIEIEKRIAETALSRTVDAEVTQRRLAIDAERRAEQLRREKYISDVSVAAIAWRDNNIPLMESMLQQTVPSEGQQDLRQFEWYYLWRMWKRCKANQRIKLPDIPKAIAFSPDGTKLAVALGTDRSVVLVDAATGKVLNRFGQRGPQGWANEFVVFSPDSSALTYQSDNRNVVRLRNLVTGSVRDLKGHKGEVYCAAFSPDGALLVTGSADKTVRLWNLADGSERILTQRSAPIEAVAFSPEGDSIATGCRNRSPLGSLMSEGSDYKQVTICDLEGNVKETPIRHDGVVKSLAFSPNGRLLASGSADKNVKVYDLDTGISEILIEHDSGVSGVAFSPNGKLLASSSGATIKVLALSDFTLRQTLKGHYGGVVGLDFGEKSSVIASVDNDRTMILWDLGDEEATNPEVLGFASRVTGLRFCPWGEIALRVSASGKMTMWDPTTGSVRYIEGVESSAISKKGILATVSDGSIRLVNLKTAAVESQFPVKIAGRITTMKFSPTGEILAIGTGRGVVRLLDTDSGQVIFTFHSAASYTAIHKLAFSPDGKQLASSQNSIGKITLWNADEKQKVRTLDVGLGCGILSLAYSPSGQMLAVGRQFGRVQLWDLSVAESKPRILPDSSQAVVFSGDGATLFLAGGGDYSVRVLDVETLRTRALLPGSNAIRTIGLSPDGRTFAICGLEKASPTVRLLRAATEQEVRDAGWR